MEIQDGRYRAKGVQGALGRTGTGKIQIAVECELMDADGTPGEHLTWFGYFTEDTKERTFESLRHFGWEGDDLSDLTGIDRNEVSLVIKNETYKDKTYPKIAYVNAPGGGLALKEQLNPDEAREFARQMRGEVLAFKQAGPRKAKPRQGQLSPEPPPHTDEDIGF